MADNKDQQDQVMKKLAEKIQNEKPSNILDFMIEFIETEKKNQKLQSKIEPKNEIIKQQKRLKSGKSIQFLYADPFQSQCKIDKMKQTYNSYKDLDLINKKSNKKKSDQANSNRADSAQSTKDSQISLENQQTYNIVNKAIQTIKKQQLESQTQVDQLNFEIKQLEDFIYQLQKENESLKVKEIECFQTDQKAQESSSQKQDQQYSVKGNILFFKKDNYKYQMETQKKLNDREQLLKLIEKEKAQLFEINKDLAYNKIIHSQNQQEIEDFKMTLNSKSKLIPSYITKNSNLKNTKDHIIHKCEEIINELQTQK